MLSVLQTPVMNAHLDGRSLLQAVEKDGRPLSSLRRISQSLRDPSSCRSEASCLERVGLHDRSPGTTGTHSAGRVGIAGEIIRLPGHASRLRRRMLWQNLPWPLFAPLASPAPSGNKKRTRPLGYCTAQLKGRPQPAISPVDAPDPPHASWPPRPPTARHHIGRPLGSKPCG